MRGDGPGSGGGGGGTATQQHHQSKFDPSAGGGGMSREHRTREKDSYERERDNLKEKMNGGHRPVTSLSEYLSCDVSPASVSSCHQPQ